MKQEQEQASLSEGLDFCKGCQKKFKRISMHLKYSIACKGYYLMSELDRDTNKKQENTRLRVKKHREALREQNLKVYNEERRHEREKERAVKREIDKEGFDEKRRMEKQKERAKRKKTVFKTKDCFVYLGKKIDEIPEYIIS